MQQATTCLAELDQSPLTTTRDSMNPFFNAIVKPELLKHQDRDVKLLVATCICEITRITAPEAPYNDEILKVRFSYLNYLLVVHFLIHKSKGKLFPYSLCLKMLEHCLWLSFVLIDVRSPCRIPFG